MDNVLINGVRYMPAPLPDVNANALNCSFYSDHLEATVASLIEQF